MFYFAGAPGFGPGYLVLETRVLPLDDTPIRQSRETLSCNFCFLVQSIFTTLFAELFQLYFTFYLFLVFASVVIRTFANIASQS